MKADNAVSSNSLRFGDEFELDLLALELRRSGKPLKLERLPTDLLLLLIERRGQLITRDEIVMRVWGKDVFVDTDNSINAAIRKIRQVLNDDPENPRYVQTVTGRGYRFIATVEEVSNPRNVVPIGPATAAETPADSTRNWSRYYIPAAIFLLATASISLAAFLWLQKTEYFWRSPIVDAHFQTLTNFDGVTQAAAVSRDGHFVAFLSDRDGHMDVWLTQVGSGQFHNLTRGSAPELVNPSIRALGFSPDGSFVTYWSRKQAGPSGRGDISIWAVPTLGGQPRPYLEGVAELDWSRDGSRLAYHTPGPGDPLFVSDSGARSAGQPIFTAPVGLHAHFPLWSPDSASIYFVQGSLPDKLDIWRIPSAGGTPERITSHNAHVSHPVLLDRRTLMYLASDPDGSGPWLHTIDVQRRIPHTLRSGPDRYTSLAASADGLHLVATLATPKRTLWRLQIPDSSPAPSVAAPISLTTGTGFSPRLGRNFLLYVSATGTRESIWKVADGTSTELWRGEGAQIFGGPALSADERYVAFSVRQAVQTLLYVMDADGTHPHVVSDSLTLQGSPAWAPDGKSLTSAADDRTSENRGVPHLFRIPLDGQPPTPLVQDYSIDPTWSSDGSFVIYSGPDVGTTFSVAAVTAQTASHPLPPLTLTRGARHLELMPGGRALVVLRGEVQHKNLWLIDLQTGAERQLTSLAPEFDIRDFSISPDGHDLVLERVQERSDIVLFDLPRP